MQLSYTTLRIYEYALPQHFFFSSFQTRKKLAKGTWNMWNTLSEWPNIILSSKSYSRGTEGSGKQVFRVRAWMSVGARARARVCVCVCVCVC